MYRIITITLPERLAGIRGRASAHYMRPMSCNCACEIVHWVSVIIYPSYSVLLCWIYSKPIFYQGMVVVTIHINYSNNSLEMKKSCCPSESAVHVLLTEKEYKIKRVDLKYYDIRI